MKLTDEETDRALEFKWIIDMILFERERAVLYARVYGDAMQRGCHPTTAATLAKQAIVYMERAFEGVDTPKESAHGEQAKAN